MKFGGCSEVRQRKLSVSGPITTIQKRGFYAMADGSTFNSITRGLSHILTSNGECKKTNVTGRIAVGVLAELWSSPQKVDSGSVLLVKDKKCHPLFDAL